MAKFYIARTVADRHGFVAFLRCVAVFSVVPAVLGGFHEDPHRVFAILGAGGDISLADIFAIIDVVAGYIKILPAVDVFDGMLEPKFLRLGKRKIAECFYFFSIGLLCIRLVKNVIALVAQIYTA